MESRTFVQVSQHAEQLMQAGDWSLARDAWLGALEIAPDQAQVMLELSYLESLAGNYRLARDWALRAARSRPRCVEGMVSLVHRLRTFNEVAVLRGIALGLLDMKGAGPLRVLVECASQLSNLNDFDLALRCAEAAVDASAEDLPARLVRGQMLAHFGRFDRAEADFRMVLERNPRVAHAWWLLCRLRKQTPESNHVRQLTTLLKSAGLRAAEVAALARALHKELDDLGDHEGAWRALDLLCRTKRRMEPHDPLAHRALIDRLVDWSRAHRGAAATHQGERTPIFIVGMHRSGTTLLEQLLDAGPAVAGLGELNDFASAMRYATNHYTRDTLDTVTVERASGIDFEGVGRRYLDGVGWRLGEHRFFSDKLPANFLNIGFICRALPHARILHLVRDPMETCFSNLRELFTGINAYSYDQGQLADYFIQYRKLMAHWHEACPGRILDVSYAELTADPERAMRRVAAFCGIDYVDAMSDPRSSTRAVATASAMQVRDRVVRREVPKWVPYARHLQPLANALRQGGVDVPELPA